MARERETRAQTGGKGTMVLFKVEPSQPLNPQSCLPGLIPLRPLAQPHLSELHCTSISICLSLYYLPLISSSAIISYSPYCVTLEQRSVAFAYSFPNPEPLSPSLSPGGSFGCWKEVVHTSLKP